MFSCRKHFIAAIDRKMKLRAITLLRKSSSPAAAPTPMSTANIAGIAVFSSICLGAVGLGIWQTKRYSWKIGVIEHNKSKLIAEANKLPSLQQSDLFDYVNEMKGRRVTVTGTFAHDKEILVGPRSAPAGLINPVAQGLAINPQGYYVITPLQRTDKTIVFINRGWVPIDCLEWSRPLGPVTLDTVVSEVEKKNTFSPKNDPASMKLLWIEPEALRVCANQLELNLNEVVIFEEFEAENIPVTRFPAVKRRANFNEEHVSPITHAVYAVTWFSLAAAGFVMTYYKFRGPVVRKLRSRIPPVPK